MGILCVASSVLVALLAAVVADLLRIAGVGQLSSLVYTDRTCELLGAELMTGAEDVMLWRDGVALASAGDLGTTFQHNAAGARGVGVFAVDLTARPTPKVRQVPLSGMPPGLGGRVVGHGLFVSNLTEQVYVINHGDAERSVVEVFAIEGSDLQTLALRHVDRISSELFPYHGINDVAEGRSPDEVFVSIWRGRSSTPEDPAQSKRNKDAEALEFVKGRLLGPGWGSLGVLRCARQQGAWTCARTDAWGLASGNGMMLSPDRSVLFVSSPEELRIFRYNISAGAAGERPRLVEIKPHIQLPCPVDNMVWDDGQLIAAGIPLPTLGHGPPGRPGDVFAVHDPLGPGRPSVELLLRHDGSKLNRFSGAVRYGRSLLAGSPWAPGLLHCQI